MNTQEKVAAILENYESERQNYDGGMLVKSLLSKVGHTHDEKLEYLKNATGITNAVAREKLWEDAIYCFMSSGSITIEEREASALIAALIKVEKDLCILPSTNKNCMFSYSRKNEDTDKTRVVSTFGRICRRQLKIPTTYIRDEVLGKISGVVNELIWPNTDRVQMLFGRDIVGAYSQYIGHSCMSGRSSMYVEVYAQNEDTVALLAVFNDNGNCIAKALLWTLEDKSLFLERVYHHNEHNKEGNTIIAAARMLGANISSNPYSSRRGSKEESVVKLNIHGIMHMPYMDTFSAVKSQPNDQYVFLSSHGNGCLHSTSGGGVTVCCECETSVIGEQSECPSCGNSVVELTRCGDCGDYFDEDNMTFVESIDGHVCEDCRGNYSYCDCCDEYHHQDDTYEVFIDMRGNSHYMCEHCRDNNACYCEDCNNWYDRDVTIYVESSEVTVCNDCYYEDFGMCAKCNESFRSSSLNSVNDGNDLYCDDCMDSDTEECIGCQDRFDTETMYDCNETGKVCSSCRDSDTFECQECSELFMLGVAIQIEGEEDMCPKCAGKFIAAAIDAE